MGRADALGTLWGGARPRTSPPARCARHLATCPPSSIGLRPLTRWCRASRSRCGGRPPGAPPRALPAWAVQGVAVEHWSREGGRGEWRAGPARGCGAPPAPLYVHAHTAPPALGLCCPKGAADLAETCTGGGGPIRNARHSQVRVRARVADGTRVCTAAVHQLHVKGGVGAGRDGT